MFDVFVAAGSYAGLLNAVLVPGAIYLCWRWNDRFSFREHPLSFARRTHTRWFFMVAVVTAALLELLFVIALWSHFPTTNTQLSHSLLTIGLGALVLAGVTSLHSNRLLHRTSTVVALVALLIWALHFHMMLYTMSAQVAMHGLALSSIAALGLPLLHRKYGAFGMSELLFAGVVTT